MHLTGSTPTSSRIGAGMDELLVQKAVSDAMVKSWADEFNEVV
jgi:hypothetical protein